MAESFEYVGSELELFRHAQNWKGTLRRHIHPYLSGRVLEVGAGMGGSTRILRTGTEESWTCLEPDAALADMLKADVPGVEAITGVLDDLPAGRLYDSILYIDVIEHIENDYTEVRRADSHLAVGGYLVILCPAHQWLYSPFDRSVGHFRRYSKGMFRALRPPGFVEKRLIYLDSVGLFASIANKFLLRQSMPTRRQIAFWDSCLVLASRPVDWTLRYSIGKSVLAVWQKAGSEE